MTFSYNFSLFLVSFLMILQCFSCQSSANSDAASPTSICQHYPGDSTTVVLSEGTGTLTVDNDEANFRIRVSAPSYELAEKEVTDLRNEIVELVNPSSALKNFRINYNQMREWNGNRNVPIGVQSGVTFTLNLKQFNETFAILRKVYNSENSINKKLSSDSTWTSLLKTFNLKASDNKYGSELEYMNFGLSRSERKLQEAETLQLAMLDATQRACAVTTAQEALSVDPNSPPVLSKTGSGQFVCSPSKLLQPRLVDIVSRSAGRGRRNYKRHGAPEVMAMRMGGPASDTMVEPTTEAGETEVSATVAVSFCATTK